MIGSRIPPSIADWLISSGAAETDTGVLSGPLGGQSSCGLLLPRYPLKTFNIVLIYTDDIEPLSLYLGPVLPPRPLCSWATVGFVLLTYHIAVSQCGCVSAPLDSSCLLMFKLTGSIPKNTSMTIVVCSVGAVLLTHNTPPLCPTNKQAFGLLITDKSPVTVMFM